MFSKLSLGVGAWFGLLGIGVPLALKPEASWNLVLQLFWLNLKPLQDHKLQPQVPCKFLLDPEPPQQKREGIGDS